MDENTPMLRARVVNLKPGGPSYGSRGMPSTSTSSTISKTDEAWIKKVRDRVDLANPMDHPDNPCTIFKVPKHIRQLDRKAYDPVIASFGPFHHRHPFDSSIMSYHKWRWVQHLLLRHRSQESASQLLDICLLELKNQDGNVRSCYSEKFPPRLDAHQLALIMLLDGCFIICLMLKVYSGKESLEKERKRKGMEEETTKKDEGKEGRDWKVWQMAMEVVLNIEEKEKWLEDPTVAGLFTLDLVVHDLLKLENQIPFFIIQLLFDHLKTSHDGNIDLVDLALQLFKGIHPEESKSFKKKSPSEYHHLLHLFYSSRIPAEKPAEPTSTPGCIRRSIECIKPKWKAAEATISQRSISTPRWIPSATELDRSGVKFERKEPPAVGCFKRKNPSVDSFLNITFEQRKMKITPLLCLWKLCLMFRSGRMEIPPLQIYDYTGPLFQNLIAFEQCYYDTEMYITIYALFMDCIINQAEDVRLLHLEGILQHKLNNDQAVAKLFNKLGCQIHFSWEKNYLANQIERVNEFYDSRWHKWLAGLRRDYLGSPWAIISVLAAIFLLLLTVEQAIFSALSYFHSS